MNEKLPPPSVTGTLSAAPLPPIDNNEDYRCYDTSAGVGIVGGGGIGGGGVVVGSIPVVGGNVSGSNAATGAYHSIAASGVPLEFGGTLKSNKSSKNSSNQHSPQKKTSSSIGTLHDASCCTCFTRGHNYKIGMPFWPALLANLGICALLVGYIFIGSFVFLTIENSGDNVGDSMNMKPHYVARHEENEKTNDMGAAMHQQFVQMPQTSPLQQKPQVQQFKKKQKRSQQQDFQQQSHELLKQMKRNLQQEVKQQQQQQQQQTIPFYSNEKEKGKAKKKKIEKTKRDLSQRAKQSMMAGNRSKKQQITMRTPKESTATYIAVMTMQEENNKSNRFESHSQANNNKNNDNKARSNVGDVELQQTDDDDDDLHAIEMADEPASMNQILANDNDRADANPEELERQRTVDNIWDITVSLNILYKENWTRLAALEIAKFQDQLVKRLVMDLTMSTANGATTKSTSTAVYGRNSKHFNQQQQYGSSGEDRNGNRNEKHNQYERQNIWRLQNVAQQYYQQQHRSRWRREFEWNFATAFLYSLTVITTVGYGTITPRTTLGRMVTIGYATFGIPLTLIYLSSIGAVTAKLARIICTRVLCCCFCRNHLHHQQQQQHSYGRQQSLKSSSGGKSSAASVCSIFSRPQITDRKCDLKLKQFHRQQQQQQQQQQPLPYCYVRPPASSNVSGGGGVGGSSSGNNAIMGPAAISNISTSANNLDCNDLVVGSGAFDTLSMATTTTESRNAHETVLSWSLIAPIGFCVILLFVYITTGAIVIALYENWSIVDGVYFCFMSLSTIGFCDLLPGLSRKPPASISSLSSTTSSNNPSSILTATTTRKTVVADTTSSSDFIIWFCAFYILTGLTLTSMCINLLHDEISTRMRVVVKIEKMRNSNSGSSSGKVKKDRGFYVARP